MKTRTLIILSLLSAFILHLAWTEWCPGYIVFVGLVPLLVIENYISENKLPAIKMYGYAALAFFAWNLLSTWWLKNASFAGMLTAFIVNTFLFSGVFQLFHLFKKATNPRTGYLALIIFWLTFEYFYLNGEISWTWLNFGNAFAKDVKAVQWYEFTGTLGGSFWVLISNLIIFRLLKMIIDKKAKHVIIKNIIYAVLIIIIPIIISLVIYTKYEEKVSPVRVLVIQPNIDPYEKFVSLSNYEQTIDLIDIAEQNIDDSTDYVVCPETAITSYTEISELPTCQYTELIHEFIEQHPSIKFVVGITLRKTYMPGEKLTPTAKMNYQGQYYDTYNSAIQIDTTKTIQIYHKSQLVVGVEKMPYPKALKFLEKIMLRLGGTFRSHATQKERSNFISPDSSILIAPVICWENVFGEYVTDYVKKGSDLIFVVTNEGWWGDTQSHRHLNHYSRLRAIENRRSVVRSANTGTSSIINQRGDLIQTLGWWKKGALKGTINANDKLTFYTIHGDFIGKTAMFLSILCGIMWVVAIVMKRLRKA